MAVLEPAKERGYTCFVEEVPTAFSRRGRSKGEGEPAGCAEAGSECQREVRDDQARRSVKRLGAGSCTLFVMWDRPTPADGSDVEMNAEWRASQK